MMQDFKVISLLSENLVLELHSLETIKRIKVFKPTRNLYNKYHWFIKW